MKKSDNYETFTIRYKPADLKVVRYVLGDGDLENLLLDFCKKIQAHQPALPYIYRQIRSEVPYENL